MPSFTAIPWAEALPPALALLAGALLLVAGRRLFWLTVGIAGFLAGFALAAEAVGRPGPALFAGLVAGVVAALLAVLLVKVAVGFAGFLAGGTLAAAAAADAGLVSGERTWLVFILAGLLAGFLAGVLFQAALVAVSAALGAGLVVEAAGLAPPGLALLVLFAVGVTLQAWSLRRRPPRPLPAAARPQTS